jgi:hypothetical protein
MLLKTQQMQKALFSCIKKIYIKKQTGLSIIKYSILTVTIITIRDSVLWRLKAVTMRLVLESFKILVLASSFWYFLWRPAFILQKTSHCDGHKCNHLWRFWDSLKTVTKKTVIESFKSPSLSVFVTICDLVYFYTSLAYSTDLLI